MELGAFSISLTVKDIEASIIARLLAEGFQVFEFHGWATIRVPDPDIDPALRRELEAVAVARATGVTLDVGDPEIELARYRLLSTGYFADVRMSLRKGSRRGAALPRRNNVSGMNVAIHTCPVSR